MKRAILLTVFISGCATAPLPEPVTVNVPVPVPCVSALPDMPTFTPDSVLLEMGRYDRTLTIWNERLKAIGALMTHRAIMEACVKP